MAAPNELVDWYTTSAASGAITLPSCQKALVIPVAEGVRGKGGKRTLQQNEPRRWKGKWSDRNKERVDKLKN